MAIKLIECKLSRPESSVLSRMVSNLQEELVNHDDLDHANFVILEKGYTKHNNLGFLSEVVERWRQQKKQTDLFKISGLPMFSEGDRKSEYLTLLLSNIFGNPVKFHGEGDILMRIQNDPNIDSQLPSYGNSLEFPPHTDMSYIDKPPAYFLLHGVKVAPDLTGGLSVFVSISDILKSLSTNDLEILQQKIFKFDSPEHYSGKNTCLKSVIEFINPKEANIRYRSDTIRCDEAFGYDALGELNRAIRKCSIVDSIGEGAALLINNYRLLHGRTSFDNRKLRQINRVYISD